MRKQRLSDRDALLQVVTGFVTVFATLVYKDFDKIR